MRQLFVAIALVSLVAGSASARSRPWVAYGPYGGFVVTLEADPRHPSTVYAVSWCLYKSTDGGRTWARRGIGFAPETGIVDLETAASRPARLYALTTTGLYVSNDGGRRWTKRTLPGNRRPDDLEVDPQNPSRLYLAGWEGLFRSDDGGGSWRMLSDAPTDFVTVAPSASNVVYFAEYGELLRSNDFGAHWGRVYASASAPRRGQLAIDPANPDILYFEEPEGVFKLVVGHSRPTLVLKAPPGQSDAAIAVDPRNGRVFAARRGQIYSSTNGGATWRRSRAYLPRRRCRTWRSALAGRHT